MTSSGSVADENNVQAYLDLEPKHDTGPRTFRNWEMSCGSLDHAMQLEKILSNVCVRSEVCLCVGLICIFRHFTCLCFWELYPLICSRQCDPLAAIESLWRS